MKIKSNRLTIRPVIHSDASAIFDYRSDKKVNQYQGFLPETLQEVESFISDLPTSINTPGTWFQLAIILSEKNRLIGDLGLHFLESENTTVEVGCTISSTFHRMGYATEALLEIKDYLFTKLGKKTLTASVDPDNKASIKMLERIGMKQISLTRKSYLLRGQWVDDALYQVEKD